VLVALRNTATMLWKEMVQLSNRLRFGLEKTLFAAGVAVVFYLFAREYLGGEGVGYESLARFGRYFFLTSLALFSMAACVAVLITASVVVSSERSAGRLPLLLVTPLGPRSIVAAKGLGVYIRAGVWVVAIAPIYGLLLFFGGVDRRMVVEGLLFLATNVWLYGCIGLFFSAVRRRPLSALGLSALTAFSWNVAIFFVAWWLAEASARPPVNYFYILSLSPLFAFSLIAGSVAASTVAVPFPISYLLVLHLSVNVLLGLLFFLGAFLLFGRSAFRIYDVSRRKARIQHTRAGRRSGGLLPRLARALPWRCDGLVSKELLTASGMMWLAPFIWFATVWGLCLLLVLSGERLTGNDRIAFYHLQAAGLLLLAVVFSASALAGEKEERTLGLLHLSSLGRVKTLAGKAGAILIGFAPAVLVLLGQLFLFAHLGSTEWAQAGVDVVFLAVELCYAMLLGLYFSSAARSRVEAVALAALTWLFGPLAVALFLQLTGLPYVASASGQSLFPSVLAFAVITVAAGGLVLWRRRVGFPAWGYLICYLVAYALAASAGSAVYSRLLSGQAGWDFRQGAILLFQTSPTVLFRPGRLYAAAVSVVISAAIMTAWMVYCLLVPYEGQVRRSLR